MTNTTPPTNPEFRIFAFPADIGGCGFYRIFYPLTKLQSKGHKVAFDPDMNKDIPDSDMPNLLVFQRAYNHDSLVLINGVARTGQTSGVRMVMDIDDDIWSIDEYNEAYWFYSDPEVLDALDWALSQMDAITVTSEHLKKVVESRLHSYSKAVVYVIPNAVPDRIIKPSDFSYDPQDRPLLACWWGSPTHEGDVKEMVGGVGRYLVDNPQAGLMLIGTDYRDLFPVSIRKQLAFVPWQPGPDGMHDMINKVKPDVVLAPLKDTAFTQGKSNLRILEANAMGIPVIASNAGPYEDGSPGTLLVNHRRDWYNHLTALESVEIRKNLSNAGRAWVGSNHTQEVRTKEYAKIYQDILDN